MTKETKKKTNKVEKAFLEWVTTKEGPATEDAELLKSVNAAHISALNEVIDSNFKDMNLLRQKAAAFVLSLSEKSARTYGILTVQEGLKEDLYRVLCK